MTLSSSSIGRVQGGVEYAIGTDGVFIPIGSLAHVLGRDGSGNVITDTVQFSPDGDSSKAPNTYVQTLTYTNGLVTGVSQWVKS